MSKEFVKVDEIYRVRIDTFTGTRTSYISNKTFDSYEAAWEYAKKESKKFEPCGFCVIYDEMPKLDIECSISPFDN